MDITEACSVLGVSRHARPAEIRRAYLDLIRVWHPDRFEGDPRLQMKANGQLAVINVAYDFMREQDLKKAADAERRPEYDPRQPPQNPAPAPGPAASHSAEARTTGQASAPRFLFLLVAGVLLSVAVLVWVNLPGRPPVESAISSSPPTADNPYSKVLDQMEGNRRVAALPSTAPQAAASAEDPLAEIDRILAETSDEPTAGSPLPLNRPETGKEFGVTSRGRGELTIVNGSRRDAVFILHERGNVARAIYVRTRETALLKSIAQGIFTGTFESGRGWSDDLRAFTTDVVATDYEQLFDFNETQTRESVQVPTFKVTLHQVRGGNARTRPAVTRPPIPPAVRVEGGPHAR